MEILVREYGESDYATCRLLWEELTQHHARIYEDQSIAGDDPGRGFDTYLERADRCGTWVAESGGKVVGFAGLLDTVGEEGVAEIEPVITSLTSRSRGIGTGLIEYMINVAKNMGFRFLTIKPVLRNERSFDLYVRLGFNKVGSIELFQDLSPKSKRKWIPGITIHGRELSY